MIVIINSECTGKSREKSQRILDEFLPRIGRRCWSGRITDQGLRRLKETLAKKVTTSSSICCQRVAGTKKLDVLWFLGNRKKFTPRGHCSVSETSRAIKSERFVSSNEVLVRAATELSALFHDLGKSTEWFQDKLRKAQAIADPIRHELVSYMIMRAMLKLADDNEIVWLEKLADRKNVGGFLSDAFKYAFDHSHELIVHNLKNNRLASLSAAIRQADTASGNKVGIDFYPEESLPKFSLVSLLVLTHHRLPHGFINKSDKVIMSFENMKTHWDDNGLKKNEIKFEKALSMMLSLPSKKRGIWEDNDFLNEVSFVAQRLLEASASENFQLNIRLAATHGRTALILGDHKGSQIGNTRFPEEGKKPASDLIYANTNRNLGNALAEPLSSHLKRVRKETCVALDNLFVTRFDFPSIEVDDMPESIRSPRVVEGSPFNWQAMGAKETKSAFKAAPEGTGFFGVLMAGTGSGKTRMAPTLLSAVSQNGVRMNVCTGMRSLTLQSGREYQEDMRFRNEDISVVIGDELTSDLFNLERAKLVGTDAEQVDEAIVVTPAGTTTDHILPKSTARLINVDPTSPNSAFLASPILVATLDTLMSAADATRGRHVVKSLRVASADLVIDEIDDYGNEDLVAIARLVYLTASFGRRVIISSATVSPEIGRSLFTAYREGWAVHCHAVGKSLPILSGWYSEVATPVCDLVISTDEFNSNHNVFVKNIISGLQEKVILRKAKITKIGNPLNASEFFDRITDEIVDMHFHHGINDEKSGKRLSVGVVRWNNVAPSILHARHLLNGKCPDDHDIFVIPYNGTLLPAVRYHVEATLNKMLRRKFRNGRDPILSNDFVRETLDNRATAKNVVILVVTTSIEEVGRDHDFDFAIVEPGSLRGVIQMGGRVRRHRQVPTDHPNLAIMERSFKEVRSQWGDAFKPQNGYFAYPGIQTPLKVLEGSKTSAISDLTKLPAYDATTLYDMEMLATRLDARDTIAEAPSERSLLGIKERELTRAYLEDGLIKDDQLSVEDYVRDPMAMLTSHHPRNRKFRRTDAFDVPYTILDDGKWYVLNPEMNTNPGNSIDRQIDHLMVSTDRLFLQLKPVEELTKELSDELWSGEEELPAWKKNSLSTISRPLHVKSGNKSDITKQINISRFCYNPSLGMVEIHKWLKDLL